MTILKYRELTLGVNRIYEQELRDKLHIIKSVRINKKPKKFIGINRKLTL